MDDALVNYRFYIRWMFVPEINVGELILWLANIGIVWKVSDQYVDIMDDGTATAFKLAWGDYVYSRV